MQSSFQCCWRCRAYIFQVMIILVNSSCKVLFNAGDAVALTFFRSLCYAAMLSLTPICPTVTFLLWTLTSDFDMRTTDVDVAMERAMPMALPSTMNCIQLIIAMVYFVTSHNSPHI